MKIAFYVFTLVFFYLPQAFSSESYYHTIDKHPICNEDPIDLGNKLWGACNWRLNGTACTIRAWIWTSHSYEKYYATCWLAPGGEKYEWIHTSYIPWRD